MLEGRKGNETGEACGEVGRFFLYFWFIGLVGYLMGRRDGGSSWWGFNDILGISRVVLRI